MPMRDPLQRERDLAEIARRYIRKSYKDLKFRESQASIAKDLGITQAQVSYDIKTLRERWQSQAIQNVDEAVSERMQELFEIMQEAWAGWEKSIEPKEREIKQKTESGPANLIGKENELLFGKQAGKRTSLKIQTSKVDSAGNPAFLNVILDCVRQICTLRGLDKLPPKNTGPNPEEVEPLNPALRVAVNMTEEERDAYIAELTGSGDSGETPPEE